MCSLQLKVNNKYRIPKKNNKKNIIFNRIDDFSTKCVIKSNIIELLLYFREEEVMKEFIKIIVEVVNSIHDIIMSITANAGLNLTDKDLHLWVFGFIGIFSFFFVHLIFKHLSRYSITAVSFIYTFTVMLVLVFAIEIQQKITGRGQMEFDDAVVSLWGFILFFAIFLVLKGTFILIKKFIKNRTAE
jgi:hypothetical protein